MDPFERLRKLLSEHEELFNNEADAEKLPGIFYKTIIERLSKLAEEWDLNKQTNSFIEDILVAWARENDPSQVDATMMIVIRLSSPILEEWLENIRTGISKLIF